MEEIKKKKSNKGLIVLVVVLAILLVASVGYICYDKFMKSDEAVEDNKPVKTEEENISEDPFSIANLVKNKYIKKIETTKVNMLGLEERVGIEIRVGKVYVLENFLDEEGALMEATGISGTPKYVHFPYPTSQSEGVPVVLTEEGDLYYADFKNQSSSEKIELNSFTKVTDKKVVDIYTTYSDDGLYYPLDVLTVYAELEDGSLVSVRKGKIESDFSKDFPRPDMLRGPVCAADSCYWNLTFDFDGKTYYNDQELKYNGNSIIAKDGFNTFGGSVKEIEPPDPQHLYIVGKDDYIYEITINNHPGDIKSIKLYSEKKLKSYVYNEIDNDKDYYSSVTLTYEDESTETIKNVGMSTLYYRYVK